MSGTIDIFEGKDGQHYFTVKAANGKALATSEGYKTEAAAEKGAQALTKAVATNPDTDTVDQLLDAGLIEVVPTSEEDIAAFADEYGEYIHGTAVPSSAHVIEKDRTTLRTILERAVADGWTLAAPAGEEETNDDE